MSSDPGPGYLIAKAALVVSKRISQQTVEQVWEPRSSLTDDQ
ncbi:hypothetical protein AB0901_09300 [Streptomyces roseifaciens]